MADTAHYQTDLKLEEMEKRLSAIYSRAEKEIGERWKEYLVEAQAEIDEFQKAYDLAKKGGDQKEISKAGRKLSKAKRDRTLMNNRFKDLTERTAAELANVNKTALAYINGQLPEVYSINYNVLAPTVDGVGGYSFALVDADTVRNLATTDKSLLPYKQLDEKKDIRWNVKKMNAEVLQGIVQGEPMDRIASRLSKVIGMDETAAIRNARTMVTGAENKGRQDSYARATADGIILEKEWIATNDKRTRHWHAELDGKTVPQDKPFSNAVGLIMFPGDPGAHPANVYNCRCTMAAVVKGFGQVKIKEEVFVGQSGGVQFLGLRQTGDIDVSEFTEGKKAGESFVKKPTRPQKLDYANEEEYMQAREKYRSDKEAYEKQIDRIVRSAMQNQAFTTKEQAVEWARKIGITIDPNVFDAVDLRSFNEVKSTLEEMFERFPQVRGYDVEAFDGVIRRTTFDIGLTDMDDAFMLGSGGIKFNGKYFADYETALRDALGNMADGFTVVGDGSFSTVVRHEFGHNVQTYIETKMADKYHHHVDDWRTRFDSLSDWKEAEKAYFDERHRYDEELRSLTGLHGSSEYSTTNELELFAEGFAEWSSGGTTEFAEAFGKFFERWFK